MLERQTLKSRSAILLIDCPDRRGLVASVTEFVHRNNGNILYLDQHVDLDMKVFFMRIEWDLDKFAIVSDEISTQFEKEVAAPFEMRWRLHFSDDIQRMAIFVSKLPHCLYDILARCQSGEWKVEVPLIVSNHPDLEPVAKQFGIPFHVFSFDETNRRLAEITQMDILRDQRIDLIVLARYMQVLSDDFVALYLNRIINIHHSFLPAFPGSRPYHSAYRRGVKIIGATSHYVTPELDAGPIIEQDVARVGHQHSVNELIRKGRDLEKVVLSRAIWSHLQRKLLVYDNRTVQFV